jgi:hypothetical protein
MVFMPMRSAVMASCYATIVAHVVLVEPEEALEGGADATG